MMASNRYYNSTHKKGATGEVPPVIANGKRSSHDEGRGGGEKGKRKKRN